MGSSGLLHWKRESTQKNQKKIKNKIKLKSPMCKHHTALLYHYYIGRGNQPRKIKKKIKNKIKLKSPICKHHTALLCHYYIGRGNQPKKNQKYNQIKITYM